MSFTYSLHINRLKIHSFHGVLPQEQIVGASFYITLDAEFIVQKSAYESDHLQGTINYDEIVNCIHEQMTESVNTLEHLAYKIAQKLLKDFPPIKSISLLIEKENPPTKVPCKEIGIKIHINR